MDIQLGVLRSVPARTKWMHEAHQFTPWLAANITQLGNALGLELEVENMEVAVGPYSADIVAKDTGTGHYIIIENQLEKTNHDHLGKCITYAAVLDASTIIWLATNFTEEHQKALDWLNDHTTEQVSFYGVQVELWQIDDSHPAVRFNVLSRPNEIVRQVAKAKASDDLTAVKKTQFLFWTDFKEKLSKTKKIPSLQTPRPQYWFDISLGKSNIHLSNVCNTDNGTIGVRVYIRNQIAPTMLPFLESKKAEIESLIGTALIWNPNPDNQDKIIALNIKTDLSSEIERQKALDWLVEYTIRFREVFAKIVRDL